MPCQLWNYRLEWCCDMSGWTQAFYFFLSVTTSSVWADQLAVDVWWIVYFRRWKRGQTTQNCILTVKMRTLLNNYAPRKIILQTASTIINDEDGISKSRNWHLGNHQDSSDTAAALWLNESQWSLCRRNPWNVFTSFQWLQPQLFPVKEKNITNQQQKQLDKWIHIEEWMRNFVLALSRNALTCSSSTSWMGDPWKTLIDIEWGNAKSLLLIVGLEFSMGRIMEKKLYLSHVLFFFLCHFCCLFLLLFLPFFLNDFIEFAFWFGYKVLTEFIFLWLLMLLLEYRMQKQDGQVLVFTWMV